MAVSPMSISEDSVTYTNLTKPDQDVYCSLKVTSHYENGSRKAVKHVEEVPLPQGKRAKSSHVHRLTAVSLGFLCAILFMSTITLSVLYMRGSTWSCNKEQIHGDNDRLSKEKDQLQKDRDLRDKIIFQLWEGLKNQSDEIERLQKDYNTLVRQCGAICPEGWERFSWKCYLFSAETNSWNDSQTKCKIHGGNLVVIKSKEKQEFVDKYAIGLNRYWIGLKGRGDFVWVDGTTLRNEEARWKPGAPNADRQQNEHCVFTGPNQQLWGDTQCSNPQKWICERNASK